MAQMLTASSYACTSFTCPRPVQASTGAGSSTESLASSVSFVPAQISLRASPRSAPVERSQSSILTITNTQTTSKSVDKVDWSTKRAAILQKGVRSVPPKEALRLTQEAGFVILDVRPKYEYEEVRAEGSVSAEMYRLIKEWTPWDILRRAGFAFFGVFTGTEENPGFIEDVKAAGLSPDSKIIVACGFGGTTRPSQSFTEGKESRSLIAAYALVTEGFTNVYHMDGGLNTWFREELPVDGTKTVE